MRKAERWFEVPANEPIAMANALILGGGAPTLTLEAGALTALLDHEVEFDVVSTAGAGMLVGLLYAAPKGIGRREALIATKELGVHDSLYDVFPINFKVFLKPGQAAASYRRWQESLAKLGVGQMGRLAQDFWGVAIRGLVPIRSHQRQSGHVRRRTVDRARRRFRAVAELPAGILSQCLLYRG
jgi:predicted acylesterase/phospholipase RssA